MRVCGNTLFIALFILLFITFHFFLRKAPSKCSLKLAISEEIFRLRIKNLQKGVGKYHFQRFIGRGIIIFQKSPKSCPLLLVPVQSM